LKLRSLEAQAFLLGRPEETLAVVTHGTYLCMLVSFLMFGRKLTSDVSLTMRARMHSSNTGITKFVHDKDGWMLWNWNDDAHLG
jgi:hypothetical protein